MVGLVTIVDADQRHSAELAAGLLDRGYSVRIADSLDTAVHILSRERVDLLLSALRVGDSDGLELVRFASEHSPHTTVVVMGVDLTSQDRKRCAAMGVTQLLSKPFSVDTVSKTVSGILRRASASSPPDLTLLDTLQLMHMGHRSISIYVGRTGRIDMQDGEIVHAVSGQEVGRRALVRVLASTNEAVRTGPMYDQQQTIFMSFSALMIQAMKAIGHVGPGSSQVALTELMRRRAPEASARLDRHLGTRRSAKTAAIVAVIALACGVAYVWLLDRHPVRPTQDDARLDAGLHTADP